MNNKRLNLIANLFTEQNIYDIGSDHGLLPKYLLESKKVKTAHIIEVNQGPLNNAKTTLKKVDNTYFYLSDGLKNVNSIVEDSGIVIAGMGGKLISDIILNSFEKCRNANYLYIQPNNSEQYLRKFLNQNDFKIVKELLVSENKIINHVLKVQPLSKQNLSSSQLYFGLCKNDLSIRKFQKELDFYNKTIKTVPKEHENYLKITKKIKLLSDYLKGE